MKQVKVGDRLDITWTEAVMLSAHRSRSNERSYGAHESSHGQSAPVAIVSPLAVVVFARAGAGAERQGEIYRLCDQHEWRREHRHRRFHHRTLVHRRRAARRCSRSFPKSTSPLQKLVNALQDMKSVGSIRTPQTLAWDLRYARQFKMDEGGRRIVLVTDRPIGFGEAAQLSALAWIIRSPSSRFA